MVAVVVVAVYDDDAHLINCLYVPLDDRTALHAVLQRAKEQPPEAPKPVEPEQPSTGYVHDRLVVLLVVVLILLLLCYGGPL